MVAASLMCDGDDGFELGIREAAEVKRGDVEILAFPPQGKVPKNRCARRRKTKSVPTESSAYDQAFYRVHK